MIYAGSILTKVSNKYFMAKSKKINILQTHVHLLNRFKFFRHIDELQGRNDIKKNWMEIIIKILKNNYWIKAVFLFGNYQRKSLLSHRNIAVRLIKIRH